MLFMNASGGVSGACYRCAAGDTCTDTVTQTKAYESPELRLIWLPPLLEGMCSDAGAVRGCALLCN